jgi:hypothetical protein
MSDTVYFVYSIDYDFFSDYGRETINLTDKYFTNEKQAEMYMDYLDLTGKCESYDIVELECGDDDDYAELIKEEEERIRIEQEERVAKNKRKELENYALLKSRIEGGNWTEIYHELLKEHGLE